MFGALLGLTDEQRAALMAGIAAGRYSGFYAGRPVVPEWQRCVNEGAEGCSVLADDRGWCPDCWSTIEPEGAS